MGTMAMRNSRPALALLTGIAACAVPTSAYAQEAESYNFDLPAQDLGDALLSVAAKARSEEHTSELQSLMRISYAVFCLKKKTHTTYHLLSRYDKSNNIKQIK